MEEKIVDPNEEVRFYPSMVFKFFNLAYQHYSVMVKGHFLNEDHLFAFIVFLACGVEAFANTALVAHGGEEFAKEKDDREPFRKLNLVHIQNNQSELDKNKGVGKALERIRVERNKLAHSKFTSLGTRVVEETEDGPKEIQVENSLKIVEEELAEIWSLIIQEMETVASFLPKPVEKVVGEIPFGRSQNAARVSLQIDISSVRKTLPPLR